MPSPDAAEQELGLRERKNRRTRRAIVRATVELTLEGGYAAATIPRIAERADVAPRTVSTWFPTKDEILFEKTGDAIDRATAQMREGSGSIVDRLEAWLTEEIEHHPAPDPEIARLRRSAIEHDPELRARERQLWDQLQSEVSRVVARDTDGSPGDMGPQVFAGATMGFLWTLGSMARQDDPQDGEALLREGVALLRATLSAVTASSVA
ncbi:TetR/AcrR family transcriptional regulator [Patulibacter sp.]|uniref:TetR/AcrR family transcriptional regulator n=1 Tax=Patulibacter sp. TaxID=1912859 RepID=UPI0027220A40|nr:TetR/AcrR family transcriptional regulator [Patulibacter sp.]MDO9407988.1 TetR/AcrR family transcriptional regulator [Patulibacter sp.]